MRASRRQEIIDALKTWNLAWDHHDLDGVMNLFHDDVVFENWNGARVTGKENLRLAWTKWFDNHGGFRFIEEDTFVDSDQEKVLYRWRLEWPSIENGHAGEPEIRRGVDVLHFQNGMIIRKLTYSKTTIEISGKRLPLTPAH